MRLFKLLVALLILGTIGLFLFENIGTFTSPQAFLLNVTISTWKWEILQFKIELYLILLLSAAIGFIVGMALMLKPYRKTKRLLAQEKKEKQPTLNAQEPITVEKSAAEA
jgi:NADH:ubiquinone oxidoreductase subunit K